MTKGHNDEHENVLITYFLMAIAKVGFTALCTDGIDIREGNLVLRLCI